LVKGDSLELPEGGALRLSSGGLTGLVFEWNDSNDGEIGVDKESDGYCVLRKTDCLGVEGISNPSRVA
jgi:hypothetical protein